MTGASSEIGLELANLLAADSCNLVLVGRNRARLEELASKLQAEHHITARCEPRDLSEPHAAMGLWTELAITGITIDILVNNAGAGVYGNVEDEDPEALERMLQLNVVTLTSLTRLALPRECRRAVGEKPERRLCGRLPTSRTTHGRLLREQSVRLVVLERLGARAKGHRCKRHSLVPGAYEILLRRAVRSRSDYPLQVRAEDDGRSRGARGLRGHEASINSLIAGLLSKDRRVRRRATTASDRGGS